MEIDESEFQKKPLRTLVLSTNVNDYDTGELIVDGSITKTLNSSGNEIVENPILAKLHGLILGRNTTIHHCLKIISLQVKYLATNLSRKEWNNVNKGPIQSACVMYLLHRKRNDLELCNILTLQIYIMQTLCKQV
jgi:hypothetical protein